MADRSNTQTLKALRGARDLVLSGVFGPGERLSEVSVAERLGISRTPLRAALAHLEQEGLLELIPSGGYAVRSFTFEEVFDAIELRGVMEGTAARLAAERGVKSAKMRAINAILLALDDTVDAGPDHIEFDHFVELNVEFHSMLAGLSGSETVRREVERAGQLPFASPSAFLEKQEHIPEFRNSLICGQQQHRMIVQAIELREGARAEALTREHARLARQNFEFVAEKDRTLMRNFPALALVAG